MTETVTDAAPKTAVSFHGVTKVYPPEVVALDDVSVDVMSGSIHAFVGENGAGKSTLMKVLAGEVRPDSGSLTVKSVAAVIRSPREAMAAGIGMVHQEILLINELSVIDNILLGVEPLKTGLFGLGRIDRDRGARAVRQTMITAGMELPLDVIVGELTVAAKQKVEVCKLLHRNVDILILDEPTAVLTPQEIPEFFAELRRLRASGKTICFISHHLDEVVELCDTVTVLRNGTHVATIPAATTSTKDMARLMVERDVVFTAQRSRVHRIETPSDALRLTNVARVVPSRSQQLGPISLHVGVGEIVGVAGVDGNGQTELVRCLIGDVALTAGTIEVDGVDCTRADILERRKRIAYVPAERKVMGGSIGASLVDNTVMTHHRLTNRFRSVFGWILDRGESRSFAESIRRRFDVTSNSVDQHLGSLSGGNQQKVILGRELSEFRSLVVLEQPTRGLDVGSIEYVHQRILAIREGTGSVTEEAGNVTDHPGKAQAGVLLISSDLDELFRLSDRIVVMFRGTITLDAPVETLTVERVGAAMLEGRDSASAVQAPQ